jgi:hypothetical protein
MIAHETLCEKPSAMQAFEPVGSGVHVADALSPARCAAIVDEFRGHEKWKPAKITRYEYDEATGAGQMRVVLDPAKRIAERVHFVDVDLDDYPNASYFFGFVREQVLPFIKEEYGLATQAFGEAEIVRYPPGGVFIPHSDSNKLKPYRAFSVILYLNDTFSGGETSFPTLNYKCVPKTGRVLIFPSHLLHGGETVRDGEKQIIVLWVFYPGHVDT